MNSKLYSLFFAKSYVTNDGSEEDTMDWLDEVLGTEGEGSEEDDPAEVVKLDEQKSEEDVLEDDGQEELPVATKVLQSKEQQIDQTKQVKALEVVAPKVEEKPAVVAPVAPKTEEPDPQVAVTKFRGELEKQYAISQEDADLILSDPQTVLPKLMTNMHLAVLQSVGNLLQQSLPNLISRQVQSDTVTQTRLQTFSQKWPELVQDEAGQKATMAAIQALRQAEPTIGFEAMVERVGPLAYQLLGKQLPQATPAQEPAPVKAVPKPHRPAKSTSTSSQPAKLGEQEEFFAQLVQRN